MDESTVKWILQTVVSVIASGTVAAIIIAVANRNKTRAEVKEVLAKAEYTEEQADNIAVTTSRELVLLLRQQLETALSEIGNLKREMAIIRDDQVRADRALWYLCFNKDIRIQFPHEVENAVKLRRGEEIKAI